jgi:membrane fusion protein, multidrug efflux system
MSTTPKDANDSGLAAKDPAKRSRALLIVAAIFVLAGVIWLLLWIFVFSTRERTDNAYVGGNQVALSSQVPGTVVAILTDDTQHVSAGQVLVKLDPTDADVKLRQASSALAQAV